MSLAHLITALSEDLSRNLPRNTHSFQDTRARRAELARFETVLDVARALDASSSLPVEERRALVTVLVEEAQRGTSQVWTALLVLAFAPMLHRIRHSVGARRDDDLDSVVLAAFIGAARSIRPGAYTSLALRWATEKEVLTRRIAEGRLGPMQHFRESIHSNPTLHEPEAQDTLDDVLRALEEHGNAEILDVLLATRARDESLRAYVVRTCPNRRERASRYEQLCRARLRFERELRERLPRAA
jgi:hypothetical protein